MNNILKALIVYVILSYPAMYAVLKADKSPMWERKASGRAMLLVAAPLGLSCLVAIKGAEKILDDKVEK